MDAKSLLSATQKAVSRASTISDENAAYSSIDQSFEALRKITKYMQEFDIEGQHYCPECGRKGISYDAAGKAAAYLAKITNDTVRLMEYHKGNADSRLETKTGMEDLVKSLTSDQLAVVLKWMDENNAVTLQ